ncbi:MAG TPA: helix-turn-helix domain-containing protein [Candidatus Limnocylindria bacterium]|jgi:HTH-type transcriptional regulator/antitoxin HipB|nr:helix-turn-helix domain-containing protein [Candidatus Limnocylindria bacterium]
MKEFPVKTPQQFGSILQGFRRDQNLTQQAVGAKVGLAQNAISNVEADSGTTSVARLFKVLAALDLELVVRPRRQENKSSEW